MRPHGTAHLGSVRGIVAAFSVGSTAFGPLLFAVVRETADSYTPVLLGSAALPLAVAAAAFFIETPARPQVTCSAPARR